MDQQPQGQERKERLQAMEEGQRKGRKRNIAYVIAAVLVIAIAAGGLSSYTGYMAAQPGQYDAFAQCLTEKGVEGYGAYWCPNCQRQKLDFGNSFRYVTYIECAAGDPEGKATPEACTEKGVTGYPTWIRPDGNRLVGYQKLQQLAEFSGCRLQ